MTLLDQHTGAIQQLCARHKVRRLFAFGSVLTDRFDSSSDVDLVVDFEPQEVNQYADNYFNFKFALEDTLSRPIDLIEEKAIRNPYFRSAIETNRRLIWTLN